MENTKISVIIPNWNGAKILEAVIKSCLNQTLQPFEVLVCDDGSTDDSKKVIEKINDPSVIWVPSLHSGTPAVPRNNGLKISKGEWIAFCDSDDEWLPTKLEKQIELAKELNCLASCTNAFIKKDKVIQKNLFFKSNKKIITYNQLLSENKIICSSAIIHSSIYKSTGGFPENNEYRSFEDYIYWLRVSTKTNFVYLNEPLVVYNDHPETSIRSLNINDSKIKNLTLSSIISWLNNNEENILNKYYKTSTFIYIQKQKFLKIIKKI